ncbi:MAG: hypothetical protein D1H97_16570 [Paracoccus sp. BP8]|nr:MAG: hypothetical protein D1H97_16570 [Paracoccus sp. BP8]
MTGDFSRWRGPNAKHRGYSGVLMQQGRLYTDSDWNENTAIQTERMESALARVIGPGGTPKAAPGFAITAGAGGFGIGAGSYWVDGVRVENPAPVSYADQGGGLNLEPLAEIVQDGAEMLIHLELRKDEVSALQDGLLADPALSGVDTAVRERAHWRVAIRPVTLTDAERAEIVARAGCGHAPDFPDWRPGTGRMSAGTAPAADLPDDSDCLIPPDAGYLSQENQLYRVQIVRGGTRAQARFVWSRENGAVAARLGRNEGGEFILLGAREDEALGFPSGGWIEVQDDRDTALGRPGTFTRMTLTEGVATFSPGIGNFDQMVNPRIRRWDHGGASALGLPLTGAPTLLERGVQVAFTDGSYVAGDAWMFEARAATGAVVWPPYPGAADEAVPPMTWGVRRVPLALARRAGDGIAQITDLRATFPALTCLQAEDVGYDDSATGLGAETVQEAIEALAGRSGQGLCTALVRNRDELRAAVEALRPGQSIRLCLTGGNFQLQQTLRLERLGHVIVQGTGPQTVVSVAEGEAALLFRGCASVRVADLSVNGGPNGDGGRRGGRHGALTMLGCGDISVERVRARCRPGPDRASACIASIGTLGRRQEVRVRDCAFKVGQAQIGLLIVGAWRALVQDNSFVPLPGREGSAALRLATDRRILARIRRGLLRFGSLDVQPDLTAYQTDGRQLQGRPISLPELIFGGSLGEVPLYRRGTVILRGDPEVLRLLATLAPGGARGRITEPAEMRRRISNLITEAATNQGRVVFNGRPLRLLRPEIFRTAADAYIGEAICIAGPAVEEAQVSGNRIEGADCGIRIAASSARDEVPPRWRDHRPGNAIRHALVNGNTILLRPASTATPAFGLFMGHGDRLLASQNSVLGEDQPLRGDLPSPHFGFCQFGWRGDQLVWSENRAAQLTNGFAVIPALREARAGIWRLRDNAAPDTLRAYVVAAGVAIS